MNKKRIHKESNMQEGHVDITGLDKAEVLAALYNNSRPLGMGHLHFVPGNLPIEEARALIEQRGIALNYEYLKGRVMKVDLTGDELDPRLYDRDNGPGAAAHVIERLRQGKTNPCQ